VLPPRRLAARVGLAKGMRARTASCSSVPRAASSGVATSPSHGHGRWPRQSYPPSHTFMIFVIRATPLTAEAGASLAELMSRMSHSSTRAAQAYLHARQARDQQLAATLDKMARRELRRSASAHGATRSGTQRARGRDKGPGRTADDQGQEGT
jgi:hypothetical protein